MPVDTIAITALIIAILGSLSRFINDSHIKKCHMCCIDSDCRNKKTPPDTPISIQPKIDNDIDI